jgi:hypothetical protein
MSNRARARVSDPWTSHLAADSVGDVTPLQNRILQCFDIELAMTDEQLIHVYNLTFGNVFFATDSSIRSRRHELVDMAKLVATKETRKTRTGRKSIIWTRNMVML